MQPDGIVLMGPFGSGKSHIGRMLDSHGLARFTELESIVYDRFEIDGVFQTEKASKYIRTFYLEQLNAGLGPVVFESTGMTQRPLLLEVTANFTIPLIQLTTPRDTCIERIKARNATACRPVDPVTASEFYDHWKMAVAPQYEFALEIDGSNEDEALKALEQLIRGGT